LSSVASSIAQPATIQTDDHGLELSLINGSFHRLPPYGDNHRAP